MCLQLNFTIYVTCLKCLLKVGYPVGNTLAELALGPALWAVVGGYISGVEKLVAVVSKI